MMNLSQDQIINVVLIVVCLCLSGMCSGLILGIMSLDRVALEILKTSGSPKEQKAAAKVLPLRAQANWLLVTLILAETVANESLPLLLSSFGLSQYAIIALCTLFLVMFGEIIPNSICMHHGLAVGAAFSWVVNGLKFLLSPIAYPISKLMDFVLGEEMPNVYNRSQLKELIQLHSRGRYGELRADEVAIIQSALQIRNEGVGKVMTNLRDCVMLEINEVLDAPTMTRLLKCGHSRVPVYDLSRKRIQCVLLVKNLSLYDPSLATPVRVLTGDARVSRKLLFVPDDAKLVDVLHEFETGGLRMAMVFSSSENVLADQRYDLRVTIDAAIQSRIELRESGLIPQNNSMGHPYPSLGSTPIDARSVVGLVTVEDVVEMLLQTKLFDFSEKAHYRSDMTPGSRIEMRPTFAAPRKLSESGSLHQPLLAE